jgi:outer membrane protein assembly factor BamB
MYQERLGGGGSYSASSVAADGKLYFTSEEGDVFVVRAGPRFELLATNSLDEIAMATPAISEGTLYFRTRNHLVAIGQK